MSENIFTEMKQSLVDFRKALIDQTEKEIKDLSERFSEDNMKNLIEAAKRLNNVNSRRNTTVNK